MVFDYFSLMVSKIEPIESYGEFEEKVISLFEEISPIPFIEFHELMQDYARIIINLREHANNAKSEAREFNASRLYDFLGDIERNSGQFYIHHPLIKSQDRRTLVVDLEELYGITDAGMILSTLGDEYVQFAFFHLYIQDSTEAATEYNDRMYVGVSPLRFIKNGDAITNQIVQKGIEFEDLTYKLRFNTGDIELPHNDTGIRIPRQNYQRLGTEVTGRVHFQDVIVFPEGNLIKQAHITAPYQQYYPGTSLFGVDINLAHTPPVRPSN